MSYTKKPRTHSPPLAANISLADIDLNRLDQDYLAARSISELMHICAIQHLLSDGTKAQLVDRLRSHASVLQARADAASAAEALALKVIAEKLLCRQEEALLKAAALQNAIFNSANFSSIATDAKGVIQIFNVGAERMLGYTAAEVLNKITPADISDPQELIARAKDLSVELSIPVALGVEALVFKASRGMEDIYELTYFRKVIIVFFAVFSVCFLFVYYYFLTPLCFCLKDGSRFPAVVSVTALRDAHDVIIGYLFIGNITSVHGCACGVRV